MPFTFGAGGRAHREFSGSEGVKEDILSVRVICDELLILERQFLEKWLLCDKQATQSPMDNESADL